MKYPVSILISLCLFASAGPNAVAQGTGRPPETKAEVPALTGFHTVVYKLWHTAWPKKDYGMMAALLPDIERGTSAIARAELPGILRDKKAAWSENVTRLQDIVEAYREAVEKNDRQKLLDEGEQLHSQFEKLVRVIRPALKEVEEFHAVLYVLYHYYLPENRFDSIKVSVTTLKEKMDAMDRAQLPDRLMKKDAAFRAARAKLSASVQRLAGVAATDDEKGMKASIHSVHSDYEALDKVLQ